MNDPGAGLPVSAAPPIRVVAAVVWRDDRVLLTQRPPHAEHALQWEFPGGKIEAGETVEQAVVREIREELGVAARAIETLATSRHAYPQGREVEIVFVRCALDPEPLSTSRAVHALRWIEPANIDLDGVLAGDHAFLESLGARRRS